MTSYEKENINEYIEIIQKSNSGVENYIVNETKNTSLLERNRFELAKERVHRRCISQLILYNLRNRKKNKEDDWTKFRTLIGHHQAYRYIHNGIFKGGEKEKDI